MKVKSTVNDMKHFKLLASLLAIGTVGAATALTSYGYRKMHPANTRIDAGRLVENRIAPARHVVPARTPASVVRRASESEAPTLRGLVVSGYEPYICEFKGEKGLTVANIFSDYIPEPTGGAFYAEGKYYVMELDQPYIGSYETYMTVYDAETWDVIDEKEEMLPSSSGYCMTYDPTTNAVYGYFFNDEMEADWQMFGRMNLATGEVLGLNNVDSNKGFLAIACGTDGYLYGVNVQGMYCRITKKGEITYLGHTDIKPAYVQSAAIDPATGKFYWAGFTDEGQGGLYVVDPETYMAELVESFPNNQEIVGLYVVENRKESEMPEDVLDLNAEFVRDTFEGTVSFTAPDAYCDGSRIMGTLTAHAAIDGNHYEKSVAPGEDVTFDVSVKYAGIYNAAAWVSTDKASGNKSYAMKWVGPDNPVGVSNLSVKVEGTKATVTWDAPQQIGQHGGYVDPDNVTYIISREGYGRNYVRDYTECTFEDDLGEGVSADVRYSVRSVNGDLGGRTVYTDWVHVGDLIMSVPLHLSPSGDFNKFIVIDGNEDGNTWAPYWGGYALFTGMGDDWMLTPLIKLEAGTVYNLEYEVSAKMGVFSPEIIEVSCGMGDTAADMTQLLDSQTITTMQLNRFTTYTTSFSVPVSGEYRLGFHALSDDGDGLGFSSIDITTLASASGPAASTALSIEAADKGELKAKVSFTLPTKDSDGNDLTGISKVELYNTDRLAASASGVAPGARCVLEDTEANQGNNRYSVVAYGEDGTKGIAAQVSGWVGMDVPQVPEDIRMTELADGVHLTWTLPESGLNGGYVDPAGVTYIFVDPTFESEIAMVKGVSEADIKFGDLDYQATFTVGVRVLNSAGMNYDMGVSNTLMVGKPHSLPFHEHFAKKADYGWILLGSVDDGYGWIPEEQTVGKDGLPGVSSYYGEGGYDAQKLASGKIRIPEGSDATLGLWLMGKSGGNGAFRILISEKFAEDYEPLFVKSFDTDSDGAWEPIEVSLKDYAGKTIYLALEGLPEDAGLLVGIDNLTIRECVDYDAAVTNITIDTDEVEVGRRTATVKTWITNQGLKEMASGSYSVDFYAGDRKFASVPGVKVEPKYGYADFSAEYAPTTDDSDPSLIRSRISYDNDMDGENNVSKEVKVYVVSPELPGATGLQAEQDADGVALEWTAADISGKPVRTVTDDFESYRTFDNNRAGKWTIVDEDGEGGIRVSYFFPGSAGSLGWVVMEPGAIPTIEGGTLASRLPAYSGEKYMASYCSTDAKDWLITPELSGNAQEISFMARAESVTSGREMFEVYYSTRGTELTDFISLDNESHRTTPEGWSEFRFQVPEGAKYFAVRCVSHNRCAMHIDDFTYESAPTPVDARFEGYNVYRNGELLNDAPVATTTLRDCTPAAGRNEYIVRAVYDRGEAPSSNKVVIENSGIGAVEMDVDPALLPVYDLRGLRVTTLTEGEIYVTRGKRFIYRKR